MFFKNNNCIRLNLSYHSEFISFVAKLYIFHCYVFQNSYNLLLKLFFSLFLFLILLFFSIKVSLYMLNTQIIKKSIIFVIAPFNQYI